MRIKVKGKSITLNAKQLARAAAEHAALSGNAPVSPSPRSANNGLRIGQLVAGSMPKHPRVVIGKIHSFDRDGEARGIRGEHFGYSGRADNRGNRKLTLCTPVTARLADALVSEFANLQNDPRPGTR